MTNLPEDPLHEAGDWPGITPDEFGPLEEPSAAEEPLAAEPLAAEPLAEPPLAEESLAEPPLFQLFTAPEFHSPVRIPHLGHLCLLVPLIGLSFVVVMLFFLAAVRLHLFGVTTQQQAGLDVHYILGVEGGLYLLTLVASLFIFPLFWHKSFFAGLQWNGATAWRHRWQLISVAGMCFVLALLDGALMPGPNNAPIEEIFQAPGAAWMLFAFGVTMAPFFEESLFRGFLLPALCTAYDWGTEKASGAFVRPLEANGHPQWSLAAKVFASVVASIPFAWLHAAQTSYSLGPFLLLVAVSLVLCAVRLVSRSLAASVFVHAFYNLLLFSMMMVGTGGFRNLDKM